MDKVLTGRTNIVGAASLTGKAEDGGAYVPKEFDVNLLMLYGHMVAAGRSYIPALSEYLWFAAKIGLILTVLLDYFARAYSLAPDHPMVNLSIGIAYLHRAMQRQSDNRHWDILQAMTFLFEYHDIRNSDHEHWRERQEAEYNIARAFHQIGTS